MKDTDPAEPVRPLAGHRVISVAEQFPGPYATLLLGDLGADVVQLERSAGGDPTRAFPNFYESLNRGKRSIALGLKNPAALAAARALIARADVLFEGFRPGVMNRLGLGVDAALELNPRLIYVSLSGFGQHGPYRDRPVHDLSYLSLAGMLDPEQPTQPRWSLADLTTGLFGAISALTGLAGRATTGVGGHYDVGMFDSLVSMMTIGLTSAANHSPPETLGLDPGYGLHQTKDGRWVSLSIAFEDHFWKTFCLASGLDDLADMPNSVRVTRRDELQRRIAERFSQEDLAYWDEKLIPAEVPYGAVQSVEELMADAHVHARNLLQTVAGRRLVRQPVIVDGTAPGPRRGIPELGEHTVEVLREAGLESAAIDRLLTDGGAIDGSRGTART